MRGGSGYRSGRTTMFWIAGLVFILAVGIGLIWFGFEVGRENRQPSADQPSPTVLAAVSPLLPTATMTPVPTVTPLPQFVSPQVTPLPTATSLPAATPLPSATPLPDTPVPPTAAPVVAKVVANENGTNVRSGPGTNFSKLGYLNPGAEAKIIGQYADWWQIEYDGAPAWVYSGVVTASNTDDVPEVQPPPSPTPSPVTPTPPATSKPTEPPPPTDIRGLVADDFQVEGAPGPYGAGAPIWFSIWVANKSAAKVEFKSLGVAWEKDGQAVGYQQSYSYSYIDPSVQFVHRDHLIIEQPGTYKLYLRIGFYDDAWYSLRGPIEVVVK